MSMIIQTTNKLYSEQRTFTLSKNITEFYGALKGTWWWKKFGVGRKNIFEIFCVLLAKIFAFSRETSCVQTNFLFTLQLMVVHTALCVHSGAVHRVLV